MNQHVTTASVVPFRKPLQDMRRDEIVDAMAAHLVAAILHDALDTSSDMDVIQCLMDAPDRFNSGVVLNHVADAKAEALQILIAREMEDG